MSLKRARLEANFQTSSIGHNSQTNLISPSKNPKTCLKQVCQNLFSWKTFRKRIPIAKWLPGYDRTCAISDLISGITIGLTLIPQGLAYSSVVGVPPQHGLYGCFLGSFIYIIFGSCKDVSFGPSAVVSLLTASTIKGNGVPYATLLCFMTGVIQFIMGVFCLGFLIDFISGPVASGFTSAAALLVVTSQMDKMLGISIKDDTFLRNWEQIFDNIDQTNWDAVLGFSCLALILVLRYLGTVKIKPKDVPLNKFQIFFNKTIWLISISRNAILVIVSAGIGYVFCDKGTPPFAVTGYVPNGLPTFTLPPFSTNGNETIESFSQILHDFGSGVFVVPLVAILEDIAVCKAFSEGKGIDATQEFISIGLCNIANSFVQTFPGTGGLARSAVNNASGVRTTFGGLYTGIIVIMTLLYLTPYCYYIPKATLAAIIIGAAIFMVEVKVLKPIWKAKKIDLVPGVSTFLGCLFLPIQYGILIGIGMNLIFILYHAARPEIALEIITSPAGTNYLLLTPDRCIIFPSVHYVRNLVTKHSIKQKIPLVIDCSHIYVADYTTATVVKSLTQDFLNRKQPLFFLNLQPNICAIIEGLSPKGFHVYYDRDEFDEMCQKWYLEKF